MVHKSLLHYLPHGSRQELQRRGQEAQILDWKITTCRQSEDRYLDVMEHLMRKSQISADTADILGWWQHFIPENPEINDKPTP